MNPSQLFLHYSTEKLRQLEGRIQICLAGLTPQQVWARGGESQNAAGNLVLHLCGNVSQWILSGVDGRPDTRVRDEEFAARGDVEIAELSRRLAETVSSAVDVLQALPIERLTDRIEVQKYDVSILEAIYHVVEHFSQHTGQIILLAKMANGQDLGFYRHLQNLEHIEKIP